MKQTVDFIEGRGTCCPEDEIPNSSRCACSVGQYCDDTSPCSPSITHSHSELRFDEVDLGAV